MATRAESHENFAISGLHREQRTQTTGAALRRTACVFPHPASLQGVTNVLLATDADWLFDEVSAALAEPGTTVSRITEGRDVSQAVSQLAPDLVLLDLQIGTKGGVASCIDLRHDIAEGRSKDTKVLMLLDRDADRWIARQADADGWLIKPLDAFRLRRAAMATIAGESVYEGEPVAVVEESPAEEESATETE